MRYVTGLLLLSALLCALWLPQAGHAQAAPMVMSVAVQGLRNTPADAQKRVATITEPLVNKPYDAATVEDARKKIEDLGFFFTVTAVREPAEGGVRIVFTVVENKVISRVVFVGNKSFTVEQLQAMIQSRPGQVLNDPRVGQDQQAILEACAKAGYVYTELGPPTVTADPNDAEKLVLTFTIYEPTISEIRVEGVKKTRESVIRRFLEFHVGDVINLNETGPVARTVYGLRSLGIFAGVSITFDEPGTLPNTRVARLTITERSTGTASLGVTMNQVEGLTGFVSISENNLFGTLQRVSANVRFGGESGYQFSYTNPWIDPRRTSVTVNLYNFSTLREAFFSNQDNTVDFKEKRTGGDIAFSRPISRFTRLTLGFRSNTIKGTEDTTITDPDIRAALLTTNKVNSTSLGLARDTRDDALLPSRGSYSRIDSEFAGLGGTSFVKVSGQLRRYFNIRPDKRAAERRAQGKYPLPWVVATRLMVGTSSGMPPFLDQYQLGGSDTLRGYKQDRFPGENMALLNTELRVPVNETLGLVAFADLGDAWGGRFTPKFGDSSFTLRYGYGAGLRLILPAVGPLRLDYGINDEGKSEFTFAFGPTF